MVVDYSKFSLAGSLGTSFTLTGGILVVLRISHGRNIGSDKDYQMLVRDSLPI